LTGWVRRQARRAQRGGMAGRDAQLAALVQAIRAREPGLTAKQVAHRANALAAEPVSERVVQRLVQESPAQDENTALHPNAGWAPPDLLASAHVPPLKARWDRGAAALVQRTLPPHHFSDAPGQEEEDDDDDDEEVENAGSTGPREPRDSTEEIVARSRALAQRHVLAPVGIAQARPVTPRVASLRAQARRIAEQAEQLAADTDNEDGDAASLGATGAGASHVTSNGQTSASSLPVSAPSTSRSAIPTTHVAEPERFAERLAKMRRGPAAPIAVAAAAPPPPPCDEPLAWQCFATEGATRERLFALLAKLSPRAEHFDTPAVSPDFKLEQPEAPPTQVHAPEEPLSDLEEVAGSTAQRTPVHDEPPLVGLTDSARCAPCAVL